MLPEAADQTVTEIADEDITFPPVALLTMPIAETLGLPTAVSESLRSAEGLQTPVATAAENSRSNQPLSMVNTRNDMLPASALTLGQFPAAITAAETMPVNQVPQQPGRSDQAVVIPAATPSTVSATQVLHDVTVVSSKVKSDASGALPVPARSTGNFSAQMSDLPNAQGMQSRPVTPVLLGSETQLTTASSPINARSADGENTRRPQTELATRAAKSPSATIPVAGSGDAGPAAATSVVAVDTPTQSEVSIVEFSQQISNASTAQRPGATVSTHLPAATIQTIALAAGSLQDRPVELTLHPAELGRVRMTLQAGDGAMAVLITVERPETLDLLRRNIDQLADQLRDIGYQKLTFDFAGHGRQFGDSDTNEADDNRSDDDLAPSAPQDPKNEPLRLLVGNHAGLDIRL